MEQNRSHSDSEPDTALHVPTLPRLTNKASVYSGCCLALSTPLVEYIHSVLPPARDIVLSIGSGFGLLEALLSAPPYGAHVVGVEVAPSPNIYLSKTHHRLVHGTRFVEPLAAEASAWMFVYPRRVGLVNEYMAAHGLDGVHTVIWVGPQADWHDYRPCFAAGWTVHTQSADEVGGKAWDLIAIANQAL